MKGSTELRYKGSAQVFAGGSKDLWISAEYSWAYQDETEAWPLEEHLPTHDIQ